MVFIMLSKLKSHHQILISMVAGYIIGYYFDSSKLFIPLGDIFIRLLKMIIVPIIFTSIVSGVSSVSKSGNIRILGLKTILYYMSEFFAPKSYRGFRYNDSSFSINWPYKPEIISSKDESFPDFDLNKFNK